MVPEGYVKFRCSWDKMPIELPESVYRELEGWRGRLFALELVGAYPDGIGYGNISVRMPDSDRFFISGSATGGLPALQPEHYSRVDVFDIDGNSLHCSGPTKASSESLSHAAVYLVSRNIGAVIHVHSKNLWNAQLNRLPTTDRSAEYGTPEMAKEVSRIAGNVRGAVSGLIVMGGHEDGIIAYGPDLDTAGELLLALFKEQ